MTAATRYPKPKDMVTINVPYHSGKAIAKRGIIAAAYDFHSPRAYSVAISGAPKAIFFADELTVVRPERPTEEDEEEE